MANSAKEPLTIEKVVQSALTILDTHGVTGLSMRRLATELNIKAASLYHHVPSRDALIQNIIDTDSAKAVILNEEPMPWPQALFSFATKYKEVLKMHPGVVPRVAIHPVSTKASSDLSAPLLKTMEEANVDHEQALFIFQSIAIFVIGHTLAEVGNWPDPPTAPQSYYDQWFETGISALINGFNLQYHANKERD
ncbi:TetR family transcriptional regulator [Lederbergia sp. NSJ-179]|uniref:TetR/AcrR family transcriptional regulator n=1 Tax=Lederbergia sp. NSJ-179 TaxID=2931402 RepID=UPI001FD58641|nr:TetR family transcriptional regulator [Lederbergia sp. NSJ-179]MCJ7841061.1 TetR family transcriptional regulator [Lederbergia sp. NSJ-179]